MMSAAHERVLAALELREPDTVPVFDFMMETNLVFSMLGEKPGLVEKVLADPRGARLFDRLIPLAGRNRFLKDNVIDKMSDDVVERFCHAAAEAGVKMGYDAASIFYCPIFRVKDSRCFEDIYGRVYETCIGPGGFASEPIYKGGLIDGPEAWKALDKRPFFRLPAMASRVFSEIQRERGERLFMFGMITSGLFETTWQMMGFERFAVAVRRDREFIARVTRFIADLICVSIEVMADAGMPGFLYGDDLAFRSGPMLNPRTLKELYQEHYQRFTETAHSLGMKAMIHSCGNTSALLPWFADCGFDAVNPLEPTAGVDLAEAKRAVGGRICLTGNIDVTRILVDADREEVFAAVKRAIADAGAGGGYILAPAHDHASMSVERLRWMVEAAREYGRYPLAASPS
jgi:uroporphyrinogen decarboxylase